MRCRDTMLRINNPVTRETLADKKTNMAARKKDGAPDWKYYESADTIALFEPVKQYLLKNCKKVIATWVKICIRKFDCFILPFCLYRSNRQTHGRRRLLIDSYLSMSRYCLFLFLVVCTVGTTNK